MLAAFGDRLDVTNIEPTARLLIDALRDIDHPAGTMAGRQGLAHRSILARDFAELLRQTKDRKAHLGRVLLIISPYSAYAMATLIASDWDRVKDDIPAWRQKVGDAPGLLGALGKKYAELKQYDEAEQCLKRYVELTGDEWAYQELAACYEARGDRNLAKAAIDGYLNNTEVGRPATRAGSGPDRQQTHEGRAMARGEALRRGGRGDLGRIRNGVCLAMRRGTQGMGPGRTLDEAIERALSRRTAGPAGTSFANGPGTATSHGRAGTTPRHI